MNTNEKKFVEKTLKNYSEKEVTKLDELKALDKKARKGATIFAYVFGIVGTLILGVGMCMAMKVILDNMLIGIIIGIIGIAMVSVNYLLYSKILKKSKEKYAQQIKDLSNELLNQ